VKTYVVGGAVRDELLGLPVQDRDHVVVGATPEEMERLGYKPVGKDFPVFLHPETHEEYALARTERKSGRGYKGFTVHASPEVTLEEDLRRRDLTINAMAKADDGTIIDPFGGRQDLQKSVLRHVSEAFVEDPVRILRTARFAARFGFSVAPETVALMRRMVESGETDYLVPERVWQEFSKGLMEEEPERMFDVLEATGLQAKLFPELRERVGISGALPVRFARLAWPLKEPEVQALCERQPNRSPSTVAEELLGPLGQTLRLPRRDAGCLKRICGVQHRFVQIGDQKRFKVQEAAANTDYAHVCNLEKELFEKQKRNYKKIKELAPHQITVNAYCPGIVGTTMWDEIDEGLGGYLGTGKGEALAQYSQLIALGRVQTPEDVASFVSYLASRDADYMTGQAVMIDGGIVMV